MNEAGSLGERIRQAPLLEGLDHETADLLARGARHTELGPGEVLFHEGEPSAGVCVVDAGWLRMVKASAQGREQVLQFIGPGEVFNTVSLFSDRPNPATAVALEPTSVWILPRAVLRNLLAERPQFAQRVMENMSDRLVYLVGLVADLSLRSVSSRLARLILDGAEDGVLQRPKWFTVAELAARLGTVPDVVQRAIGRFAADGLISVTRREIRVLQPGQLREIAE